MPMCIAQRHHILSQAQKKYLGNRYTAFRMSMARYTVSTMNPQYSHPFDDTDPCIVLFLLQSAQFGTFPEANILSSGSAQS